MRWAELSHPDMMYTPEVLFERKSQSRGPNHVLATQGKELGDL